MVLALAALTLGTTVDAQIAGDEAQVKAAFVYNFLKFVEWPAEAFQGPRDSLVLAIVGDGPTADAAEHFLAAKQVGERRLVVRPIGWDQPLTGVQAVFVTEHDAKKIRRVLDATAARPILSIGDAASFATSGGIIELVIEERKVRFDINVDVADAVRLKISSKLLALTRVVHSSKGKTGDQP
jgi:hypothetical protein